MLNYANEPLTGRGQICSRLLERASSATWIIASARYLAQCGHSSTYLLATTGSMSTWRSSSKVSVSTSPRYHKSLHNTHPRIGNESVPIQLAQCWFSRLAIFFILKHTHPFNGPFSGITQVSRYQKGKPIDFTEARDSEWQWHQLGHMQVCTLLHTDYHASIPPLKFLQAGCPSCRPTNDFSYAKI